jgi:anthranilate/para-aminobenzoate synthase component I
MEPRVVVSLPRSLGGSGGVVALTPAAVLWQRGREAFVEAGGRSAAVGDLQVALAEQLELAGPGARAVGFFAYEFAATLEPLIAHPPGPRSLPDAWWAVLAARPSRRRVTVSTWRQWRRGARLAVSLDDDAFRAGVELLRSGIAAGEYFQVNLTRRWTTDMVGSPLALFAHLCGCSPPRFATYLEDRAQGWAVLCLSPELLLRRRGDRVETRPIKGTRPRGGRSPLVAVTELRRSEKDAAELVMIVDLERNDLNRACRPGSVRVVRRSATVITRDVVHLEAWVHGRLEDGTTQRGLLAAMLPGGSVTGAPKFAACRAIARLEPVPRSVYCGALGVIQRGGDLTFALPIRTGYAVDGMLHFHAGCGIVWDSDAEAEEAESRAKARSWLAVVEGK